MTIRALKAESVGKLDKGSYYCILAGSLSDQLAVLELPELLEPDALNVKDLRFDDLDVPSIRQMR